MSSTKPEKTEAEKFADELMDDARRAMRLNLISIAFEMNLFDPFMESPRTISSFAEATALDLRYAKEILLTLAANGIFSYNAADQTFALPEHIKEAVKVDSLGIASAASALIGSRQRMKKAYKDGTGMQWGEHDHSLFSGTRRFFRPFYKGALVHVLNSLEGVTEALKSDGARLADVGCGQGETCQIIGKAFPELAITGIDYHGPSIEEAQKLNECNNVSYKVASASDVSSDSDKFDAVTFFDCFHDMSVASEAAKRAYEMTKDNGFVVLIEPLAAETDDVSAQLAIPTTPIYGLFSCHCCLMCSKCNHGDALGTLCPTEKHRQLMTAAGFKSCESVPSMANELGFRVIIVKK